jgi:hypothetical protein
MLEKIISGGQTGADQAAWRVAKAYGVTTGGWMPNGGFAVTDFVFGFQADSRLASWFPADSGHTKPNPKRRGGLDRARPTTKTGPKEKTKTRLDNRLRVRKRVMSEKVSGTVVWFLYEAAARSECRLETQS